MPIRFRCVYCGQLLSIATRKSGSMVDCPKCHHPNEVPARESSVSASSESRSSSPRLFEGEMVEELIDELAKNTENPVRVTPAPLAPVIRPISADAGSESASAVDEAWPTEPESLPTSRAGDSSEGETASRLPATWILVIISVALLVCAFVLGVIVGRFAWSIPTPTADALATMRGIYHPPTFLDLPKFPRHPIENRHLTAGIDSFEQYFEHC